VSYILYLLVPLLFTRLGIQLSSRLGRDAFKQGQVVSIENANNSFLPSYLGYFFVALSIGNWETLTFVYAVLFAFTFLSEAFFLRVIGALASSAVRFLLLSTIKLPWSRTLCLLRALSC